MKDKEIKCVKHKMQVIKLGVRGYGNYVILWKGTLCDFYETNYLIMHQTIKWNHYHQLY